MRFSNCHPEPPKASRRISRDSSLRRASSASFRMTLIFFGIILMPGCKSQELTNKICFYNHCIEVEVVSNDEGRRRGLQNRRSLEADQGMLFVFPFPGRYGFWMKDTYIPLDMIWLDYAKRIVHIEENVQPCRIAPCPSFVPPADALYVLEINAHDVKKIGLQLGDMMEFRLNNL